MSKTLKVSNPSQIKRLVELMDQHVYLANNFKRGKARSDVAKGWKEVATILNSLGPPMRNEKEWQKVWFDVKFKVKKKLLHNQREREASNGRPFKQKFLSDADETVAKLISLNGSVGSPATPSVNEVMTFIPSTSMKIKSEPTEDEAIIDLPSSSSDSSRRNTMDSDDTLLSEDMELPIKSAANVKTPIIIAASKSQNAANPNVREKMTCLLEKQIDLQQKLYTDITTSLKMIDYRLKESCKYQKKRLYLEEKKLKIKEMQIKQQKIEQIRQNKIRMLELDLRRRELDSKEMKLRATLSDSS